MLYFGHGKQLLEVVEMQIIKETLTAAANGPYFSGIIKKPDPHTGLKRLPAIIVIPGGSYTHIPVEQAETLQLAFAAQGFQSFYLRYSFLNEHRPLLPQPLIELAKTIALIRQHAADWFIEPNQIAIAGFSVGGHLAALYNDYCHSRWLAESSDCQADSIAINAAILSYPVISPTLGFPKTTTALAAWTDKPDFYAAEQHVTTANVPTFVWTTADDNIVPATNATAYVAALQKKHIPVEYHLYPHGPHGMALANYLTGQEQRMLDSHVASWFKLANNWLHQILL
jgi:acetyl esterase/lipase